MGCFLLAKGRPYQGSGGSIYSSECRIFSSNLILSIYKNNQQHMSIYIFSVWASSFVGAYHLHPLPHTSYHNFTLWCTVQWQVVCNSEGEGCLTYCGGRKVKDPFSSCMLSICFDKKATFLVYISLFHFRCRLHYFRNRNNKEQVLISNLELFLNREIIVSDNIVAFIGHFWGLSH